MGALRREEDRRKAVEAALARLRKERRVPFDSGVRRCNERHFCQQQQHTFAPRREERNLLSAHILSGCETCVRALLRPSVNSWLHQVHESLFLCRHSGTVEIEVPAERSELCDSTCFQSFLWSKVFVEGRPSCFSL